MRDVSPIMRQLRRLRRLRRLLCGTRVAPPVVVVFCLEDIDAALERGGNTCGCADWGRAGGRCGEERAGEGG